MTENKKYEVKVLTKEGSCDNELFEKMAKKGDITSIKIADVLGEVVKIVGYAYCEITTEEKTFKILYVDTEEYGLISSGSEIFKESVEDYYGDVKYVRLKEIKTKKVGIRTDANSRTHVGWQGTSWECQTATTADNPVLEQRM